jgi:hypothetical protein
MGLCHPGGARGLTVGCQARNARPFVHCERAKTALNRRPGTTYSVVGVGDYFGTITSDILSATPRPGIRGSRPSPTVPSPAGIASAAPTRPIACPSPSGRPH